MIITNCDSTAAMDSCFALNRAHQHSIAVGPLNGQSPFRIKGPFEFWSLDILFVSKQSIRILHQYNISILIQEASIHDS